MKKLLPLVVVLALVGSIAEARQDAEAQPTSATAANLVQEFLEAYNGQDVDYFNRMFSADTVVLDEDGHTMTGKDRLMRAIDRRLSATPAPQLTASNITGSHTADAAWASLDYTFEQGDTTRTGFITLIFRSSGDNWGIAHSQFSIHTSPAH